MIAIAAGFQASAHADEYTPPDAVSGFTAAPGANLITLDWLEPGDPDYAYTLILRSTSGYASDPYDFTQDTVFSGAGNHYDDSGVSNGVLYYYTAYAFDWYGLYSDPAYVQATPIDAAPGPVTALDASPGDRSVQVSWNNPAEPDLAGARVLRSTVGFASNASDTVNQTVVYTGPNTACTDDNLTGGVPCYYTVFALDQTWQWSVATTTQATPYDLPPGPVTDFAGTPGDAQVTLGWYAPANTDTGGVRVFRSSTGFCESPTDAARQVGQTQIHDETATPGSLGTHVDSPLENGIMEYYTAFARDTAGGWSIAATTTATPLEPPPGTISGTVTGGASGLTGIKVHAYRFHSSQWIWTASVLTSSGVYSLPDLPVGSYRLWFQDLSGGWASEYYENAASFGSATGVTVTGGGTVTVNAALAGAGTISGTVTGGAGNLTGIKVHAYKQDGANWIWTKAASTSSGAYTLSGLVVGTYRLWFQDATGTWASEYHTNMPSFELATGVAVTAGGTTTINADLAGAGTISGTVTGGAGNLTGIKVHAYRQDGSNWIWTKSALTASGAYTLSRLSAGTYRLWFQDPAGTWASEYYENTASFNSATGVTATGGATTTINADLAGAGTISGTVTGGAGNLTGIKVHAYRQDGSNWIWTRSAVTASGAYSIANLQAGTYRLWFQDPTATWVSEYYENVASFGLATGVAVTAGGTTTINADLAAP
jgi:hypothetical protein